MKHTGKGFYALSILFVVLLMQSCGSASVRKAADKKDFVFGCAAAPGVLSDPVTSKLLAKNFNLIVPENTMKMENLRPSKTFWNWGNVDTYLKFTKENKMSLKWHTFIWHAQNPAFVSNITKKEDAIAIMTETITTVMQKYKGIIFEYDVANEILNEDGTMRESFWYKVVGEDYIDIAFNIARKADPTARLILNEYSNEYMGHPKADGFYNLVKGMVERKVPIDAVGLQLHLMAEFPLNEKALTDNVRRFKDLGIDVIFSEVDVRIKDPSTPEKVKMQADIYKGLMKIALAEPNVKGFIVWGLADKNSWIPRSFPGYGTAHLYDNNFKPKPIYDELVAMIKAK